MIIIIGAGLAGYQVAREFRKLNQTLPLTILTADDGRFYSKPQLSTVLTNKKTADMLATATADAMQTQLNATIKTHTLVKSIDVDNQTVTTDKETLSYDKLIIACGAEVITAPLNGNAIADVLSINHIYHYIEFEKLIKNKKHISILGAGLIACEFANDLTNAGYEVHLIAPDKTPLERFLPKELGTILQTALEQNGVHFHLQSLAERFDKEDDKYRLQLNNGKIIHTEFLLSAIGLKPHIQLATRAGIKTNRGILVNRFLESNHKNVYALGDCAEVEGHVLPFITPILNCARALANTLNNDQTQALYPAMPVVVKTPAHPIVIYPPPMGVLGEWEMQVTNNSIRALFFDANKKLRGFILSNEAVKERVNLVKEIPSLF